MFNCCARKDAQDLFFGSNARSSMADAAKGSREANCPWCFELSCFYTVGRSLIWVCDYCKGLCEPDEGNTALIRRDPLKANNEKSGYHLPKVFKSFQSKKHAMFARAHSRAQTLEDLARSSPQRELAAAAGVLRPFMILVSMPVVTRAQLAITLGFSLITEPIFGKPHEEAWEILNRPQVIRDVWAVFACAYDTATLQVGAMHMWKTLVDRLLFFKTDSNWYTILYKAAFALFGSTDSFFDEFATVQLSTAAASSASRKANSAALEAVENAIFDKLCKQQRSKLNSRQLHALAELKSSSIVQSLYSVPCLQREQSQSAIQYSIDSSFIFLASRDGSNAEGHVDPDALLLEAAWWWCGVCSGDEDAFDSVIAPRSSIGTAMHCASLTHKS
jgi:hypothetical protein